MPSVEKPVAFVCARCGSADVSRDAWADWDAAGQAWTLRAIFDYGHCHACDAETSLERQPLSPDRS